MRVLVTGVSGFVGRAVCRACVGAGMQPVGAVRDAGSVSRLPRGAAGIVVGDIREPVDWRAALHGVDAIVHLAARTHVMADTRSVGGVLDEYRRANVTPTLALARAAREAGVRRLLYASSVKAVAERSVAPIDETQAARPEDAYGVSKWEAEEALRALATEGELDCTIVRPPLVYGPGVIGNFGRLVALARWGQRVPVPLASIDNRRSLVYVESLADAIVRCLASPRAAGETFFVSDGEDLSTPELLRRIAAAAGTRVRLAPFPVGALLALGALLGRGAELSRLTGSLVVDSGKLRRLLGWSPPVSVDEGLRRTVAAATGRT